MILIDALHIKSGGALGLLDYLIENLVKDNVNFILLKDANCPVLSCEEAIPQKLIMNASHFNRKRFYKEHVDAFHSVLCFGNLPPLEKMKGKIYTYMHNVSLLSIPSDYPLKRKLISYIKREYLRYYSQFTDFWIVQTQYTGQLLKNKLSCGDKPIFILPFCRLPEELKGEADDSRQDYVFVGEHTGAKGHEYLVEAWRLLARKGFNKTLHLTTTSTALTEPIQRANAEGANIVNHGYIPFSKVINLYKSSKASVYPSLNESLGMGIVEAITAGCDIIGSDLPYLYSVCRPSAVFEPKNAIAIAEAVEKYERMKLPKTKLIVKDNISELINLLKS